MNQPKKRHGCLTAVLVLMIVANSAAALLYLFGSGLIQQSLPDVPVWTIFVLGICSGFNLICAIAIFRWKKWGFWGFIASAVIALVTNTQIGIGIGNLVFGLLGVVLLYAALQIGKENKGWSQLD